MTPLLWAKLIGAGLLAGALIWCIAIVNGWHHDSQAYAIEHPAYLGLVDSQKKANAKVEAVAPVDESARSQLAVDRQAIADEKAKLARAWQQVHTFKPPENPDATGKCAPAPLTAAYLVCFSAAAAGDAADIEACQTTRSDGTLGPAPSQ